MHHAIVLAIILQKDQCRFVCSLLLDEGAAVGVVLGVWLGAGVGDAVVVLVVGARVGANVALLL